MGVFLVACLFEPDPSAPPPAKGKPARMPANPVCRARDEMASAIMGLQEKLDLLMARAEERAAYEEQAPNETRPPDPEP